MRCVLVDGVPTWVLPIRWEAGAGGQGRWGGFRLEWLLSAYRTRNRDDIPFVASDIRGRAWFRNIGATRRQGVEFTLKAMRGGLSGAFRYAFPTATYRPDLALSPPPTPAAAHDGEHLVH